MGHHHVRVEISADRPEIGRIMLPIPPDTSKLFPKKKVTVCSYSFGRNPKIRVFGPGAQNRIFWESVASVAFVIRTYNLKRILGVRACSKVLQNPRLPVLDNEHETHQTHKNYLINFFSNIKCANSLQAVSAAGVVVRIASTLGIANKENNCRKPNQYN